MTIKDPALKAVIAPLAHYFNQTDVVEVGISEPCQVVIQRQGKKPEYYDDEKLNLACIKRICKALANKHGKKFDDKNPQISCLIPEVLHRFECTLGASVRSKISLAMRCKHPFEAKWSSLKINDSVRIFLYDLMIHSRNVIISGATNTGKTTLLNLLLETVPTSRRVISVEDTPEVNLDRFHEGRGLIAERNKRDDSAASLLSWKDLIDHCMRVTPDHIIFGEISTENAYGALVVLNSGITGFMCTIHADSAKEVINRRFDQNISFSGVNKVENIPEYLGGLVDCIIHIKRDNNNNRWVDEVYLPKQKRFLDVKSETIELLGSTIDYDENSLGHDGEAYDLGDDLSGSKDLSNDKGDAQCG